MKSKTNALVVLRPGEGRALIGKAVAALDWVKKRTQKGRMVVVGSSTTRHVVRYLLGEDPGRDAFAVGRIKEGALGETPQAQRGPGPFLFDHGNVSRGWPQPLLEKFGPGDIYIKGANAIDVHGNAGILLGSPTGGSMGAAISILFARGGILILPVSMGKLIPSIPKVTPLLGQGTVERVMGNQVGFMPIMAGCAHVITEPVAMKLLSGVKATLVAAGGVDDCSGAMTFHFQGSTKKVEKMWNILETIRRKNPDDA